MATQVQLGPALTSLAGRSGPRSEANLRHSFISSLSDTSQTPEEGPGGLAPPVLEGRNKLGKPAGPAPVTRLPWTPKPFSRDGSSDTFATVKPPVSALKPGSATPKPPPDARKGPAGSVPPLLDRQLVEGGSPQEPATHLPFCLSPQANTVILFQSRSPAQGPPEEPPRAQEGQLLRSQSEKWPRRQPSLPSDPRPVSWAPHWKEAVAGGPKASASRLEPQLRPALAAESQAGGRPAALAGFRKSWLEQTQPNPPRAASGPGTPKARPLPTDPTGRVETQELPWQSKACLPESGENGSLAPGAGGTAAGLSGVALPGPRAKSAQQPPESPHSCLPSAGGAASPGQTAPGDAGQNPATETGSQARPSVGRPLEEGAGAPPKERGLRNAGLPDASEGRSRGCARKAVLLPDPPATPPALAESGPPHDGPGQESQTLSIQQRIRVLRAENAGPQAGSLRRSFRSRPLSTDLTKVFSGPVAASEPKPRRQPEGSRKAAGELREAPQDEALPVGEADVGEAGMAGSPREPPQEPTRQAKTPSAEGPPRRQGSFAGGRPDASWPPGGGPGSARSPKVRTFSSSSAEEACPKTVRATIFEHHVQRHSVVASQLGADPAWLSLMAPFGDSPARGQALRTEGELGDSQSTDAGGPRGPRPPTEDKGSPTWEPRERPASKGAEGSLLAQRIEPRYEVLQAVGERAQSEALAAVSEGKAVTLRRQRPLQDDQRASGRSEDRRRASALGTGPPKDPPACGSQGALHSEGTGPGRSSEKAATDSVSEGSNVASWLESEKERRLLAEGAKAPDRALERTPAWAPEADVREGGASMLGQETTALPESSPWPRASCPGLLFSLDLKPPQGPEDSGGQQLRSARHGAQDKSEAAAAGRESQGLGHEARWANGIHSTSAPRASGRWRRRTLPQDPARLEEPREPPAGPAELTSRRDALHLMAASAAEGSAQPLRAPDPEQAEAAPASSPKRPLPPPEPRVATYFALTCQVSEEIDSRAGKAAAVAVRRSASRRTDPSNCQSREGGHAPGRPLGRRRGERGASDHPGAGASGDPTTEARERGQREPEVGAEWHPAGADPPLCPGPRSPPSLAPLQDGQQKRSGALGPSRAEEAAPDHYRSRVVDLDELMAEYGGESQQLGGRAPRKESSFFPWEKSPSRSPFPGNLPCSSSQREGSRGEPPPGSRGPATGASHGRRRDPPRSHPRESRAPEGMRSPPQWARPGAEKPNPWSEGPGTKASLLVDRGQAESGGEAPQSARGASPGPHPAHPGPGALWKEASPKQWAALAPAGGVCPTSDWDGKTGRQAEPPAGGVWQEGSPPAHTGAGPGSPASPGTGATLDRRRSSSEKTRQSPARPGLPWGPRLDQPHLCQRAPPERPGDRLSQGGPSPRDCASHGGTRDPGKGGLGPGREDVPTARRSAGLFPQRRSHSFYQERRTDHWSRGHLRQCFGRPSAEARDTDVLVQEASSRYGTWDDQRHRAESCPPESPSSEGSAAPAQRLSPGRPASRHSPPRDPAAAADQWDLSREQRSLSLGGSSPEADPASPPTEKGSPDFSFLEQTPRLDSGALKSRALLGKRRQRHRAPTSQAPRRGAGAQPALFSAAEAAGSAWMFRDSTEEKPPGTEEEEGPPPAERLPPAQPRRPLFPGPAPPALKAPLRKRPESEGRKEEGPPAPLCKSPKGPSPARGPAGGRAAVAPPKREGRPEDLPPPWLTELKSRRKQGQLESPI